MSAFASGDTLTPSTLNRKLASAVTTGGFSTNTVQAESGSTIFLSASKVSVSGGLSLASSVIHRIGGQAWAFADGSYQYAFSGPTGWSLRNSGDTTNIILMTDAGAMSVAGSVSPGGAVLVPSGTAVQPTMALASEASLGFYRSAASRLALSYGQLDVPDGSAVQPAWGFRSEVSLGLYRSAASHMALSYGTLVSTVSGARVRAGSALVDSGLTVSAGRIVATAGDVVLSGGSLIISNGRIEVLSAQAVGAPDITFNADTNTGIYQVAADKMGLVAGGTERVRVTGSGVSLIGAVSLTTTGASLTSANIPDNTLAIFIGGASGATLAYRSGGTVYFFSSSVSTVG